MWAGSFVVTVNARYLGAKMYGISILQIVLPECLPFRLLCIPNQHYSTNNCLFWRIDACPYKAWTGGYQFLLVDHVYMFG